MYTTNYKGEIRFDPQGWPLYLLARPGYTRWTRVEGKEAAQRLMHPGDAELDLEDLYKCEHCDKQFSTSKGAAMHTTKIHGRPQTQSVEE